MTMYNARHRSREIAFQMLYASELRDTPDIHTYFKHFQTVDELQEFAAFLVNGVRDHKKELDEAIEKAADNWRISRMSAVDRCILRLSAFEALFSTLPIAVIIDESVELAHTFGTKESSAFVHGILHTLNETK